MLKIIASVISVTNLLSKSSYSTIKTGIHIRKMSTNTSQHIISTIKNGIHKVTFNRPQKKNAISSQMYPALIDIFNESAKNEDVKVLVFTGNGEFYSSGNDLGGSASGDVETALGLYKKFIDAIITFPKLLVAVVNGPAIGIAFTSLSLFDVVYASDKAYFHAPFSEIGFTAEGCSTYTFPTIFGTSKASEILYLSYKLSAEEAYNFGFVSKLFSDKDVDKVWSDLGKLSTLSQQSIMGSKKLVKRWHKEQLLQVNEEEFKVLKETVMSEQFAESMMRYLMSKSKM